VTLGRCNSILFQRVALLPTYMVHSSKYSSFDSKRPDCSHISAL